MSFTRDRLEKALDITLAVIRRRTEIIANSEGHPGQREAKEVLEKYRYEDGKSLAADRERCVSVTNELHEHGLMLERACSLTGKEPTEEAFRMDHRQKEALNAIIAEHGFTDGGTDDPNSWAYLWLAFETGQDPVESTVSEHSLKED